MYQTLTTDLDADGILVVTLDRPDRLNAFTTMMCDELIDIFAGADTRDDIRAIIVTGAGKAFCAGMDLGETGNVFGLDESFQLSLPELADRMDDPAVLAGVRDSGGRLTLAIHACLKPVIAAINGAAVGIGATMTLAMDVRLAAPKARIGFVFGRLGIVPEACSTWFLPRLVGLQQALDWVYRAEPFDADEGLRAGLLYAIHDGDGLIEQARRLARSWTSGRSPAATAIARRMLRDNAGRDSPLHAHQTESLAMHWQSQRDGREGVQAFRDKRAPDFTMRASTDLPPDFAAWWA
jgi:enoyl-CoA hydratase/carnithine racemase